jgi:hypothetical protein
MEHAAVLNVGMSPNSDRVHVSSYNGVHPDAGLLSEHHVSNNLRGFIYIA